MPPKLKDLRSFTIPCSIGNSIFEKALCDLGASINLMPLSIFRKLGLGEANPTTITLQLADKSLTHPQGIIEDVLVKVDNFIFPTDFIVLDMEEDKEVPIILGRPFLATGKSLIDVQKEELILRVQDEEVTFNVFNTIKHPMKSESCFRVDIVEAIVSSQKVTLILWRLASSMEILPTLWMMKQENMYCGWTLLDKTNESTLKAWDIVLLTLSLQLRSPWFLKRNIFHLTLDMLNLGSLLPYQSLSRLISLKWKRKGC